MKKILTFLLLIVLVGCNPTTETPDDNDDPIPKECTNTEIELDGECISVEGYQLNLHNALVQTQELRNYTVDITITNDTETIDLTMKFDDNLYYVSDPNQETITIVTNENCEITTITPYSRNTSSSTCDLEPMIHHLFYYDQFSISSGRYRLSSESISEILPFFESLNGEEIVRLSLSLQDEYIFDINTTVLINDIEHEIHMEYSDISNTTVTPYIEE